MTTVRILAACFSAGIAGSIALSGCTRLNSSLNTALFPPPGGATNPLPASTQRAALQTVIAIQTGYEVASAGLRLAVTSGIIHTPSDKAIWKERNRKAFHAVCLTRVAYNFVSRQPLTTNLSGPCASLVTTEEMSRATDVQAAADLALGLVKDLGKATTQAAPAPSPTQPQEN